MVKVESDRLTVRNERGELRALTGKQAKAFDVLERVPIEVAAGERLLLTANRREPGFRTTNGEIVTVSDVDERGQIHLDDGRLSPSNFKQFAHGCAVNAHRSQGKSVDSVIISADGMQRELFYVAATRGREHVLVITSDKGRLRESVGQSTARKSASELARKQRSAKDVASRRRRFLEWLKRENQDQPWPEAIRHVAQYESGHAAVDIERKADAISQSFIAAEAMSKRILGEQTKTLAAQTDSGIYRGEIIGETDMHVLQRLSDRMAIVHVKDLLNSVPDVGSKVSIVYSRRTARAHEIPSRNQENELSR